MKKRTIQLKRRYSGQLSVPFWDLVNSLPRSEGHSEAYSLGCALQDLEGRVLNTLNNLLIRTGKRGLIDLDK